MDPTACYKRWWRAVLQEDTDEARAAYHDLRTWLDRGGFEPGWSPAERKQFFTFNPRTGKVE